MSVHQAAPTAPETPLQKQKRLRKVAAATIFGSMLEWYDFYLYATMAAIVFSKIFFDPSNPAVASLLAFSTFAIGSIARPFGGILFGYLGDRFGRKQVLVITFCMMGVCTTLIGLIPSYASIGIWAPIILVFVRIIQGLGAGAELSGAEREVDGDGQGLWTLVLQDGSQVRARAVVNAAGAWADAVARLCGARPLGIEPRRRSAFTFAAPEGEDIHGWPAVIGVDESFYFKPEVGQFLGSLADETPSPPCDAQPEEIDVATAVDRIETASMLTIRRIKNKWAGLRSFVADKSLVAGYDPRVEGFFWLAGQGGYGIQSAAGASRLAADLLMGQPLCPDLVSQGVAPERLSPARFQQP